MIYLSTPETLSSKKPVKITQFSDGAENIELPKVPLGASNILVVTAIMSANVSVIMMRIALVKDAIERHYGPDIMVHLYTPYVPQARADRKFGRRQPHCLAVIGKMINALRFNKVTVVDPHSDVVEAVIDNVEIMRQEAVFSPFYFESFVPTNRPQICAPDLGAAKKVFDLVRAVGEEEFIQGIKIRDVTTGTIIATDVITPKGGIQKHVIIVDDICDGGASFIHLSKLLREKGATTVGLYVTHGIFSKGLEPLKGSVDYICASGLIGGYVTSEDISAFNEAD